MAAIRGQPNNARDARTLATTWWPRRSHAGIRTTRARCPREDGINAREKKTSRPEGAVMADRQYELVYILPPDSTEQQVSELHEQIEAVVTRMHGQIEKTENWGRKRLAYEIARNK